ncbi:hypothetical protein DAEQUDRAFT_762325 [Daedalea quercina L-15889]|uniref:Small nuclear ribonucleoprotein Prp3 C-terminal domain-containing protein n=1 Tax=Daedalea quercina L-15889 TaxID=1314783 RepID=A0A165TGX0_9APHY|nr:hypothetical protein DAEQUDRAFT_762325 [Daedalea quercina L-15889]
MSILSRQLEELNLLKHSLLPGEQLIPIPHTLERPDDWAALFGSYPESVDPSRLEEVAQTLSPAHLRVQMNGVDVWFDIRLDEGYEGGRPGPAGYTVSAKGETLARKDQGAWQAFVREKMEEVQDSEYPIFELVSAHLLPHLHAWYDSQAERRTTSSPSEDARPSARGHYHALFTSHHLVSPTKRRSLQQWSMSLSLTGFAKLGHPGVIYCEGKRAQVEEFVANVKAMQWLALRLRFVEPLLEEFKNARSAGGNEGARRQWVEVEKVGEVVEEMRRLGREKYVVEMGIGSARTNVGNTK